MLGHKSTQRQGVVKQRTGEYFWRHVCHTASYAGVQPAFRIMNRHVEIGEMDVSVGVQENVVRLDIAARRNQLITGIRLVRASETYR